MQTIRKGSQGSDVQAWQRIIGVNDDGIFGPATEAATKKWQAEKGLVADGVVGPLTWNAAGKKVESKSLPGKSSFAPTDNAVYATAKKAAPDLTEAEIQYAMTVGRSESQYGRGWNPMLHADKYGSMFPQVFTPPNVQAAKTSKNWGAVQGTGPAGYFWHVDHGWKKENGKKVWRPYVSKYQRYNDDSEGFLSIANILYKQGGTRGKAGAQAVRDAVNRGDLKAAVFEQYKNDYFELDPEKYYEHMLRNYLQTTSNVGWQDVLTESGHRLLDWAKWSFIGLATIAAGVLGAIKTGVLKV